MDASCYIRTFVLKILLPTYLKMFAASRSDGVERMIAEY